MLIKIQLRLQQLMSKACGDALSTASSREITKGRARKRCPSNFRYLKGRLSTRAILLNKPTVPNTSTTEQANYGKAI